MVGSEIQKTKSIGLYIVSDETVNSINYEKMLLLLCDVRDVRLAWIFHFSGRWYFSAIGY